MVKIESKEKLAKLLAVEDLDIQHQQVETAMFDIANRILILPIWEDMSNDLYDLFVGHEIGHALFTPTDPEKLRNIIDKTAKDYVNVIEDARIESLIKRRYPGLKKPFFKGYNDLVERGFFNLEKIDIHTSTLIDKINIRFKIPQYCDIAFNKEEQSYVDRIIESKTFEDIEGIIIDVFEYDKKAKEKQEQEQEQDSGSTEPADKEGECEESDYSSEGGDIQYNDDKKEENEEKLTDEKEDEELTEEEKEDDAFDKYLMDSSVEDQTENDSTDTAQETSYNDKEMISKTQRHFEERVQDTFIDNSSNNIYVNMPENINLKNAVEDFKSVHSKINKFYKNKENLTRGYYSDGRFEAMQAKIYNGAKDMLRKLKKDSVKTVNHIAMEFERKKAADVYKKTSISKTGILDTNKLFSAKYNEDVFKKNIRVPDGKNHGLVMFIDWSGSMACNIHDCIKQVIELTLFCKKVNIPFEVYSFTDAPFHNSEYEKNDYNIFNYRHGDFVCDRNMKIRNYLSSRMTTKEYNNASINLCILANRFNDIGRYAAYPAHNDDELFSTPLNGAILISEHIIRDFKKKNNLESVHAVWLTDGEGNGGGRGTWDVEKQCVDVKPFQYLSSRKEMPNIILKDKKTKKDYQLNMKWKITPIMFDIIKERLGINIVGFFIVPNFKNNTLWRFVPKSKDKDISYQQNRTNFNDWIKNVRKEGYFIKTESGYDEYYVLNGEKKNIKNTVINDKMTTRKMVSVFSQKNKQFKAKRVILSRFVDLITAK